MTVTWGTGTGSNPLTNPTATVNPTVNDDNTLGYSEQSHWVNTATDTVFVCVDATTGAAVWVDVSAGGGGAPHALGGAQHIADTLVAFNTKISDANLDDAGDSRPPDAHTHPATDVTDFDTEVSNNASVTANTSKVSADGLVTTHSDVSAAGSGIIISTSERSKLGDIEALADVTDATNVEAADAVMDSDISEAEGILRKTGAGAYEGIKTNLGATTDPGAGDDNTAGYAIGSKWINVTLDKVWEAVDVSTAAAVWKELSAVAGAAPVDSVHGRTGIVVSAAGDYDAAQVDFGPATLGNWNGSADPGQTDDALDQLAARVILNDAKVSADGLVTTHSDVSSAGSGSIITSGERTKLSNIETLADVTDSVNVASAGAVMDSDISEAEGILRKTGAGAYVGMKTNLGATTDPGISDDNTAGYVIGSLWINVTLDKVWQAVDVNTGAAVWKELSVSGASAEIDAQDGQATGGSTTTSGTLVDIPGATVTTSNTASTKYVVNFSAAVQNSLNNQTINIQLMVNGVADTDSFREIEVDGSTPLELSTNLITTALGTGLVIKAQWSTTGGTATVNDGTISVYGVN